MEVWKTGLVLFDDSPRFPARPGVDKNVSQNKSV